TAFDPSSLPAKEFAVSPDEISFAYTDEKDGQDNIWIASFHNGGATQITHDAALKGPLVWHPDGDTVFFSVNQAGGYQVWVAYLDARPPVPLVSTNTDNWLSDISPDGRKIL